MQLSATTCKFALHQHQGLGYETRLDEVGRLGRILREPLLVGAHIGEDGEDDEAELEQEAQHRQHDLRRRHVTGSRVWREKVLGQR